MNDIKSILPACVSVGLIGGIIGVAAPLVMKVKASSEAGALVGVVSQLTLLYLSSLVYRYPTQTSPLTILGIVWTLNFAKNLKEGTPEKDFFKLILTITVATGAILLVAPHVRPRIHFPIFKSQK